MYELNIIESSVFKKYMSSIEELGFSYVSVGFADNRENKIYGIFNSSQWQNQYYNNAWYEKDPLLKIASQQKNLPIICSSVVKNTKTSALIMRSRRELTETSDGITFSYVGKKHFIVVAVAAQGETLNLVNKFNEQYQKVSKFLSCVEEAFLSC